MGGATYNPFPNLEYLGSVEFTSASINGSSSFSIRSPESWVDNINRPTLTCLILCTSGYVSVPAVTCRVPGYNGTSSEIWIGKYSGWPGYEYFQLTNIGGISTGVRNADPTVITFSYEALGTEKINYCIIHAWK